MKVLRALLAKAARRPLALCDVGDVDGLASAALFKRRYPEGVVVLMAPSEVKKWWVKALTWDFVADLPCPGRAKVRADHHLTNKPCAEVEYYDPGAPAAALLAARALGLDGDAVARELVEAAVQTDTANVTDRRVRLLDLAVRYSGEAEKYAVVDILAKRGLAAVEEEPLKSMAERGLERDGLMRRLAEALPGEEKLFIYSPRRLGISYRALTIELEKKGARFVNILVKRGWRTYRLYCGAHRDSGYNCAELAARLGGGGHKYAAGAVIKAPIYDLTRPIYTLAELVKPEVVYVLGRCEGLKLPCKEVAVMNRGSGEG
ncbi:Fis family transcriptional regulator [Pyrobaculum sp. 3827-6]|uniref:Fis family transcriptional regulator n=1 Tax=Pyrobaculum sp. 3827-6 TaxID=2983604 RepID=UPI0021D88575|nr:Fis family transcriptional regulator [Pyrobaculum sp. 3827-6]MCU7787364.1 Fis family transcriptional regulator [Pyrobaculum sp. 3827-6]